MLLQNGCWAEFSALNGVGGTRPCLFLDRDGVVVKDTHFLAEPEDIIYIEGVTDALLSFKRAGWRIVLVTNQSGIARGMFGWAEFEAVQYTIQQKFSDEGVVFDGVVACPHHDSAAQQEYHHANHPWRKPNAGMLEYASQQLQIDMNVSWMVGDRLSDLQAAKYAGCRGAVYVDGNTHHEAIPPSTLDALTKNSVFQLLQKRSVVEVNPVILGA